MSQTRFQNKDETVGVVHNGAASLTDIVVRQFTTDAPVLYLQVFNHASPTVGTTAPTKVIQIPAGRANEIVYERVRLETEQGGYPFGTAITLAVTTGHDNGTGPTAGDEPEVVAHWQPQ